MNSYQDSAPGSTYESRPQSRLEDSGAPPVRSAARREYLDDPRRKSPVLALLLSIMPGVGQVYVGFYQQGFTNALVVAGIIALLSTNAVRGAEPLFGMFLAFFWFYNVVDAWRRAVFYNNALAGIGPAALPEDVAISSGRGSLVGGVALVLVGLVLLSHTSLGFSLAWIDHWWPIAFVAVGAWLIYPSISKRMKSSEPPQPPM